MTDSANKGRFGDFGGQYVPETLHAPLTALERAWDDAMQSDEFLAELDELARTYVGRPSPITRAPRLEEAWGAQGPIYFKREDLNHTGAHKINNSLGQVLLAKRMGCTHVIAETGAGQHGVATATVCAKLGLKCTVFMGEVDMERQRLNVYRMQLLGAEVRSVTNGTRTLKDAVNEAMRTWVSDPENIFYCLGSALGPHPYPAMVRDFQRVIGREARAQYLESEGQLPSAIIACVGGGSNAIGIFSAFIEDKDVALYGAEAGGDGVDTGRHASRFSGGLEGVLHGTRTYVLQDAHGQVLPTHSISAGLDYAAVGPEHAHLRHIDRARYESITDAEALDAFHECTRLEGLMPALESSHAIALAKRLITNGGAFARGVLINMSGRGDKDVHTLAKTQGIEVD